MSDDELNDETTEGEWEAPPAPFSFKLTIVLMALYVGYRLVQLLMCAPSFFRGVDCPFL